MKKVLIATSSPTPFSSIFYAKALAETYAKGIENSIEFEFFWSPNAEVYRNEAVEYLFENNFDTLVLIEPHIQWVADHLISMIKNDSLVEAVPTKNFYSPNDEYNVVLNPINVDSEITAKFIDFDFAKIEKEVFTRIKDFVLTVNFQDNDKTLNQTTMYWYATSGEYGPKSQDINFCEALDKAEIPIVVPVDPSIWEHMWSPYKTHLGKQLVRNFVEKGFQEVE